jgi:uncharacterized protein with HEPN domain
VRDDRARLLDILDAIEKIEQYSARGRGEFERNELVQTWIVHHLQIIGEAVRGLTDELRQQHPEVPWSQVIGMRNLLVHQYFGIDTDAVWNVVENHLGVFKKDVARMLGSIGDQS